MVPNGSSTLKERVVGHNEARRKEHGLHTDLRILLLDTAARFSAIRRGGEVPKFKWMTASQFHHHTYAEMSETHNDEETIDKTKKTKARFHALSDIELTLFSADTTSAKRPTVVDRRALSSSRHSYAHGRRKD